jgi:hypothetical protein
LVVELDWHFWKSIAIKRHCSDTLRVAPCAAHGERYGARIEMIEKEQVMGLLLGASPSFVENWDRHVSDPTYDEELLYVHLGEFAQHLVDLMKEGKTEEFQAIFDVVERLHLEGDPYVREATTIGLLEAIQNVAGDNNLAPEAFHPYLGPESKHWWERLNEFWSGEGNHV